MKVLHIVENLDRGAVENWLVRMLLHARRAGVDLNWTFYCAVGKPGSLDEVVRGNGGRIVFSPVPIGQKAAFIRALRAELRTGAYDVLHCHHDLISAIYLLSAVGLPIQNRIVHVHNADESVLTPSRFKQMLLREPMRRICLALADKIVGISNHTLDTFLGGRPRRPGRDVVHYYGIDPQPFLNAHVDREGFRHALNLPPDALILLFAGRLVPEKNPHFVLDVFAELHKREPRAALVFAGAGGEEIALQQKAAAMGLTDAVRFLGWRTDIPEIMCQCDWFILPRPEQPMEGFGIAVVEAQLAGLRLLLSKGVADDPLIPGGIWARLWLAEGADRWAVEAQRLGTLGMPSRLEMSDQLLSSPLDLDYAMKDLLRLHEQGSHFTAH